MKIGSKETSYEVNLMVNRARNIAARIT